jgi:hypothetical protein
MNKLSIGVLALVVGMIIGGMVTGVTKGGLGGVTIEDETFKGNVAVQGTLTGSGTVTSADLTSTDDVTVGNDLVVGQDISLTDNDFCIDFFATSTATQIKMIASTTVASGSNIGVMTMQYGSCAE